MKTRILLCGRCKAFLWTTKEFPIKDGLLIATVDAKHPLRYQQVREDDRCPHCHAGFEDP